MSAIPFMPLYVADYLADAAHLTTLEHGAYFRLIMNYWQRGKPLPDDTLKLMRIAGLSQAEWDSMAATMADFFVIDAGHWNHKRIDAELNTAQAKIDGAKKAGKASAEARSNARSAPVEQPFNHKTRLDTETLSTIKIEPYPETMSVLENPKQDVLPECLQPSVEKSKNSYPPAFGLLWDTFARNPNSSKSLAFAAWKRLSAPDRELCLDGAMAYGEWLEAEQKRRVRDPPVAIHLVNFIKQRRWEALLETAA